MPSRDPDQDKFVKRQADHTLAQKVEALQQRAKKMGVVSDGSGDKVFMDEGWGEDSGDAESWDYKALRHDRRSLNSSLCILADQVFARLRARNVTQA